MDLSNFGLKHDIDPKKIEDLYSQGGDITTLKKRYNSKYKQTSVKINDQVMIIKTILSDEGIINLLNTYFCDGKILNKQFCYQYLNNIVNNLNIISDWQVLDQIYRDFFNKINDNKVDIPNNTDVDTGLAANYINNSSGQYNSIEGTKIVVNFDRGDMKLSNPKDYQVEGTIVRFNKTFWFFLIDSFQINFENLTSKQRVIIDNQIVKNNYVCWKNYEGPNMYNIVLWNGANNGLKFKFTKDITQLGLNSKKVTENMDSNTLDTSLDEETSNLYGFKIKKLLQNSSGTSEHLTKGEKKNVIELLRSSKINNGEFNFKIGNKNIYFILKFNIKEPTNLPKIYYDLSTLGLDGGKNDEKIQVNSYFVDKPWTWSMLLQPEVIGLYFNGVYLNNNEFIDLLGNSINLLYLPYFTWQIVNLKDHFSFTRSKNRQKIIANLIDFIKLLNIKDPSSFIERSNIKGNKLYTIDIQKVINKITIIENKDNKGESLLNILNKLANEKSFGLLSVTHGLKNTINKLDSVNNVNTKKVLIALITEKLINQLDEINAKISAEESVWLHIQSILSTQLIAKDYIKNNKVTYNSDPKFKDKLFKIKGLFNSLSCNQK